MKTNTLFIKFFFITLCLFLFSRLTSPVIAQSTTKLTFWPYQCIDTMKTSRDNARNWAYWNGLPQEIDIEMKEIADTGANCVAIDTPYDKEFIPFLTKWVTTARKYHLHVLFRGNFSSWEGWFGYPKNMTSTSLFPKLTAFITNNLSLFANGDIFIGAPEAEDGGEFNQVEPNEYTAYRKFLSNEIIVENNAFTTIHKQLTTNWLSMNGGLAQRMFDQPTTKAIGDTVTLDHYIANPQDMGNFISYFHNKFQAKTVIGEFGAPIPEINGTMTESQQADFVNLLLQQLYKNKQNVQGINYWDLYDGSTALYNADHTPRAVVAIIKNYFTPTIISGHITDTLGQNLSDITLETSDGSSTGITDTNGNYSLIIPAGTNSTVMIRNTRYALLQKTFLPLSGKHIYENFVLTPLNPGLFYQLRLLMK